MQVNVRNGKPVVKLTKKEEAALRDAARVLSLLHTFGGCNPAEECGGLLESIISIYATDQQKESQAPAPSKASA